MPSLSNQTTSAMKTGMEFWKQPAFPNYTLPPARHGTKTLKKMTLQVTEPPITLLHTLASYLGWWCMGCTSIPKAESSLQPDTRDKELHTYRLLCSDFLDGHPEGVLGAYKQCWKVHGHSRHLHPGWWLGKALGRGGIWTGLAWMGRIIF